ncbi:DUF2442 domain-containing protein [Roseospira visakhapatnamensis]|uniref:DUF2442 domain-containing protein n=1 Tax=Roseospira visakhapatnamensis TaxID=390880 RepID=A0A7W6RFH5_9PROT|nr:DUF2442 domain-containing protein [Roseospira visakhapatnamensis]MBB4267533.1 hypothetical protein [Roseospira visakhapatnamensis]
MHWHVIDVHPVAPRTLAVQFKDGLNGTIRIDRAFCTGVFEALSDDHAVACARVEGGVVVWPGDLDLAPDTMYREIAHSPDRHYDVGSPRAALPSAARG